jgi:hypothetical protein
MPLKQVAEAVEKDQLAYENVMGLILLMVGG